MPKAKYSKSESANNKKTFTELASGYGTKISKEQLISKILTFRSQILKIRSSWLKKMNDDTAVTENKLKILENRFIAQYGSEEFYQI